MSTADQDLATLRSLYIAYCCTFPSISFLCFGPGSHPTPRDRCNVLLLEHHGILSDGSFNEHMVPRHFRETST